MEVFRGDALSRQDDLTYPSSVFLKIQRSKYCFLSLNVPNNAEPIPAISILLQMQYLQIEKGIEKKWQ